MNFDVYCDESYPDLFSSKNPQARYLAIGSLWLLTENRESFKAEIHNLRDEHHVGGEFKWQKVSPSRIAFYKELLAWFYSKEKDLRFRCILIDRERVDLDKFHESDQELGFYKFYYQLLHNWMYDQNSYQIFCDYKSNRRRDRLRVLKDCLRHANLTSSIDNVQAVRSNESVFVQLVDVLSGIVAAKFNERGKDSKAKTEIIAHTESLLGCKIAPTNLCEKKFNVFKITLQGGW